MNMPRTVAAVCAIYGLTLIVPVTNPTHRHSNADRIGPESLSFQFVVEKLEKRDKTNMLNITQTGPPVQVKSRPKRSDLALELFELVREIIAHSPDRSCYASTRSLARNLHRRRSDVTEAKRELIDGGWLNLSLRANGGRSNPRHRLSLPTQKKGAVSMQDAFLKSRGPDPACGSCGMRVLVGADLWPQMPRLDVIDCYLKSGWNVCPLRPFEKRPTVTREAWAKLSREQKIDTFYHDERLGVGLWIDADRTVFDYDSARPVEVTTLTARRGERHHLHFEGHPEIFNTAKDVAPDIDTRAVGGLICLPPTIHETGDPYEWETVTAPVPVPDELLEMWRNRKSRDRATGFCLGDLPAEILYGERDNTLWSYGRRLRASGVIFDEIDMRLRKINQERCAPPFDERYMSAKIRHIWTHRNDSGKWTERGENA